MRRVDLDPTRTALISMDMQKAPTRKSSMFRTQGVAAKAKTVLGAARQAGLLVAHVVIDYQPAFFSPNNKFIQTIRVPVLSAPGTDLRELMEIIDEVQPIEGEVIIRKPRNNPFYGTALESMLRSRSIDTVVLMGVATEYVVEGAARYAADADFRVFVLADCCAAFSDEAQRAALAVMDHFGDVIDSAAFLQALPSAGRR